MHLIKKVSALEVKHNFLITHFIREQGYALEDSREINRKTFKKVLKEAKQKVRNLPKKEVDLLISGDYSKRLIIYDEVEWFLGEAHLNEVGVWHNATGNNEFTSSNLEDTRNLFSRLYNIKKEQKFIDKRFLRGIPVVTKLIDLFKTDHYLYPIALESNINPEIRKSVSKTRLDLDDGNLRALTLAMNGNDVLKLYIGLRRG